MSRKIIKKILLIILAIFIFCGATTSQVYAGGAIMDSVSENCRNDGTCHPNEFIGLLEAYYQKFLGLSATLALLFFIIGGLMFVFSGGNKTWVDRGKATLMGAAVGLIIVFFSYAIIKFTFDNIKSPTYQDDPFVSGDETNTLSR